MNIPVGLKWHFRAIALLSVGVLLGDMILSAKFGASISIEVMLIAAMISVGSGLLLVLAGYYYFTGWRPLSYGLCAVWVPLFAFNCISNMGVATANRMHEVESAHLKKAAFNEKDKARKEAEVRLATFQKQLDALLSKHAWAGTVTADGLRSQVADLRKAEVSETALGGCGPKCRGIQNQIVEVQGKIATAEQRAGLEGQIAATKRVLADARSTVASADAGLSHTNNQSTLYAKWFRWTADPDVSTIQAANEGMGIGMAFVLAIAAAGLTIAGAWPALIQAGREAAAGMNWTPPAPKPPSDEKSWLQASNLPEPAQVNRVPVPNNDLRVSPTTVGEMNLDKIKGLLKTHRVVAA